MLKPAAAPAPIKTAIVMCVIAQQPPRVVLTLKTDPAVVEPASAMPVANADAECRSYWGRLLFVCEAFGSTHSLRHSMPAPTADSCRPTQILMPFSNHLVF
jgi:predicted secreted protein